MLFLVTVCLAFIFMVASDWGSRMIRKALVGVDEDEGLPAVLWQTQNREIDRIYNAHGKGELTDAELEALEAQVKAAPINIMMMVYTANGRFVQPSGLTGPEKEQGKRDIERYNRGLADCSIKAPGIDAVLPHITAKNGDVRVLRSYLTDAEVRAFLVAAREQANRAMVPDERFTVDLEAEMKKTVDAALAGKGKRPTP